MLFCLFETDRCNTRRNTTLTTNSPTLRRFQPLVTPSLAYPEDGIDLNRSRRSFSFRRRSSFWTTFHLLRRGSWYTTRSRTDSNSTVQEEEDNNKERVVVEDDDEEEEDVVAS